jgi:hypothetical protein
MNEIMIKSKVDDWLKLMNGLLESRAEIEDEEIKAIEYLSVFCSLHDSIDTSTVQSCIENRNYKKI